MVLFILALVACQVLLIGVVLQDVGIPYSHNKIFSAKYAFYKEHEKDYNALFMGSSRTYREINPEVIDAALPGLGLNSINLGAPATFIPESVYLMDMLLANKSSGSPLRIVFMELTELSTVKFVNWFTPRSFYYLDNKHLGLVWRVIMSNDNMSRRMQVERMYPFLQGYVLKNLFLLPELQVEPQSQDALGLDHKGYYPLDWDLQQNNTPRLLERHNLFTKDTSGIQTRIAAQQKEKVHGVGQAYIDYLNEFIDTANRYGVRVYYVIPPKLRNYQALREAIPHIRDYRVIDMGSYARYPDLYQAKYWFDEGHFNSAGANLFSTYLAEAILEKLGKAYDPETMH
jgi:hypothetical protein